MGSRKSISILASLLLSLPCLAQPNCGGYQRPPRTAPTQAIAAGFKTLAFDDEFNSRGTISPNNQGRYNWYTWNVYGPSKYLTPADYEVWNGCLTIFTDHTGSGADLQTVNSANGALVGQYGYFEARIYFSPNGGNPNGNAQSTDTSWPAFWADAIQSIPEISPFAELDFMEAVPNGTGGQTTGWNGVTLITTAHQWAFDGVWTDFYNQPNVTPVPAGFNYNAFHVYGALWTPTYVTWFIDNQPVMTQQTGPGTAFTAMSQDKVFLILGTGKNWPTTFDYVRVWE